MKIVTGLMRYLFAFNLIALSLPLLSTAATPVKQKLTILDFSYTGEDAFSFLPKHIQKLFEREIDRTGRVDVIRPYLWQKYHSAKVSLNTTNDIYEFGNRTMLEGVVSGSIRTTNDAILVSYLVYDVLHNRSLLQNSFRTSKDEKLYATLEEQVHSSISPITQNFTAKDRKLLLTEKRQTRIIQRRTSLMKYEFSINAGFGPHSDYQDLPMNAGLSYSNVVQKSFKKATPKFGVYGRYKRLALQYDLFPIFAEGLNGSLNYIDAGYWLVPSTFYIGLTSFLYNMRSDMAVINHATLNSVETIYNSFSPMLSLKIRNGNKMISGIQWEFPGMRPFSSLTIPELDYKSSPLSFDFMSLHAFFDLTIIGNFGINFDILITEFNTFTEPTEMTIAQSSYQMYLLLTFSARYRFGR